MNGQPDIKPSLYRRARNLLIGAARSPSDPMMYHKLSLIAFLAWIGLGADGLSSSCYGPPEAFIGLQGHNYLGLFVAVGTAVTVIVISASYSQIVELFPSGGGGYLVASKLLTPGLGMLAGCALLIDYVLTIALSIASGADAVFSLLPPEWFLTSNEFQSFKLLFAVAGVVFMTLLNLRGVKESVLPLVPIFLTFVITHVAAIAYGMATHVAEIPALAVNTSQQVHTVMEELGFLGLIFLLIRAYSLGAGTYTGIEAVSNGMLILREPRVKTAKRTMLYMAASLAFMALGLMVTYILYNVQPEEHRTVNAILFSNMTLDWGKTGYAFVLIALISEAAILFVAAQTGFLGGPRVLANMALDRWFPSRFSMLSDRLVTQNGILLMGGAALAILILGRGSVAFLVVLYAINVFITFVLSQLGMMRHWWSVRGKVAHWLHRFVINSIGFVLTGTILICVTFVKFNKGGWITLLLTGALVVLALWVRHHYNGVSRLLRRLDELVMKPELWGPSVMSGDAPPTKPPIDTKAKTAVILVSGYNGVGLHTLAAVLRLFSGVFKNFVFLEVGVVDAGNFKGAEEMGHLQEHVDQELSRYVGLLQRHNYSAEAFSAIGTDVIEEIVKLAPRVLEKYPNSMLFGGQLAFPKETMFTRFLHNNAVFAMQRRFYQQGVPFIILPIRV